MTLPPILSGPLSLPLVASPMFIASGPELVSAQCQAGVVGSFPALNARPQSMLVDWLQQITESNADYAVRHPRSTSRRSPSTRSCTAPTSDSSRTSR